MLGISIYPEKQEKKDILNYIDLAAKYGFKRIFTCLLSINEDKDNIVKKFLEIISYANKKNFLVTLDISPRVFNDLNISYDDLSFFKKLGASCIRLDMGFDGLKEANMSFNKENLDIEINMSSYSKNIDNIVSYNPNPKKLRASHNFYPMEYAGLEYQHFLSQSLQFKKLNIPTAVFINSPSATVGPWEIMDGLCSLEMHRFWDISTQIKHLKMLNLFDDIFIANAFASEKELKIISKIYNENKLVFSIELEEKASALDKKILFEEDHFYRGDISEYLIRSTQSRVKYKMQSFKPNIIPEFLEKGDIVIGNDNFGQYKGEMQIVLKAHRNKNFRKNLVAKIKKEELFLLDQLKPWSKFSLR